MAFAMAGYDLVHHGEGRWNGVAIAVRKGLSAGSSRTSGSVASATAAPARPRRRRRGGLRPVRRGADGRRDERRHPGRQHLRPERPDRRLAVLRRQARLVRAAPAQWLRETCVPATSSSSAATSTSRPTDADVWDATAAHGGTHVSPSNERPSSGYSTGAWWMPIAPATTRPGRFTWWDYRAGMFHKNFGMRIDHLLVTAPVAARLVDAEIDREARKGPPIPSDHAPLSIDLDEPGKPFDPDWAGALARIASRTRSSSGGASDPDIGPPPATCSLLANERRLRRRSGRLDPRLDARRSLVANDHRRNCTRELRRGPAIPPTACERSPAANERRPVGQPKIVVARDPAGYTVRCQDLQEALGTRVAMASCPTSGPSRTCRPPSGRSWRSGPCDRSTSRSSR